MGATNIAAVYRVVKREFKRHTMPVVDLIEIETRDPFKVLVGTILSARTKDATTAAASARLFRKVKRPADLAKLPAKQIEELIFPVGFYQNKARLLTQLPGVLDSRFNGRIPETVEELVELPGVGRKTANLVVAVAFNKPAICVDVHVHRIMNRLGYVRTTTPFDTEMKLRQILPRRYWIMINSYLVSFGQHTCLPRNPRCDICPIHRYCRRVGVETKYGTKKG
ncbi:MAG: endonuclease III [Chitinivibrionales bacterium]|nr:endonuclease III [Chitinivibrionales bacterium]MBD3394874.1 endonuclease III [Chitinivibrionales bacterium]